MLVTVSGPMAVLGRSSSILGSFAARLNRASAEIRSPGAMAPPKYSPAAVTAQMVVAVPKSTMMMGPPYLREAAAALTSRALPAFRGVGDFIVRAGFSSLGTTPGGGGGEGSGNPFKSGGSLGSDAQE